MNPCDTLHQGYPQIGHPCVKPGGGLPHTGVGLASILAVAIVLVLIGLTLVKAARQ